MILGGDYFKLKDYPDALSAFDQAVMLDPSSADYLQNRGQTYAKLGRWNLAIADYDEGARLAGETPAWLSQKCWVRAQGNTDLNRALAFCEAAVKASPESGDFLNRRAFVHFRRGEFGNAVADEDVAIRLNAKSAPYFYVRGLAKHRLGNNGDGDADIAAARAIDPAVGDIYADLGVKP
jgi:tetratricopeptide (TPR) repeat protein